MMEKNSIAKSFCPMKQFFSYLGASLAAIAALVSCNKEIDAPVEDLKGGVPFEICASAVDTKTTINGFETSWKAGDAINLFHAKAGLTSYTSDGQFTITAETLEDKKFKGNLAAKLEAGSYDWYAIYPYKEQISSPGEQTDGFVYIGHSVAIYQNGNDSKAHLCDSPCPLYGVSKSIDASSPVSLEMKHLTSVVEINVTNSNDEPLTVSTISISTDEDIVGSYYINFAGENVVYNPSANHVKTVANLIVNNGTALAKGETASFYIPIKPHVAENGSVITITVNGYEKTIPLTKDVTFSAGKIKKINFAYNYVAPSPQPYSLWSESISDGDYIIVGASNSDNSALNTTISSNRAGLTRVDIVDNTITTNDAAIIWHIEKSGDYYTIYNAREAKYLAATGTKNEAQLLASGTDNMSLWTITGPNADDDSFTIVNKANSDKSINATLRRNGTFGFATYGSGTGSAPVLYKLDNRELESIAITTPATKTTFNVGDSFNSDGLVVTATFSDASTSVIVPVVETPDMSSVGTKTVNVSYTFKEVTKSTSYDIVVNARPAFSVTLSDDKTLLTESEAGSGVELPSRTSEVEGYTFMGWSETECGVKTTTSPTIIPTGTYYPKENVTLYPIYKQTVSSTGWELVTDLSKVTEGVYALVTSTNSGTTSYKAFNGSITNGGHGSTTTTGFNFIGGFAQSAPEGTCELTLTVSGSGFTMYNAEKGYLYAKAKNSGNLDWHKSETSYWSYTSSNWVYEANSAYLRSYSNTTFRTYGANNGQALWMAKKTTKDVDYYVSTPVAE